jgi:AhpD family alkylhydroperoxidase
MAVALTLTTQCPYCIELHVKAARAAGATDQMLAETATVAAAIYAAPAKMVGQLWSIRSLRQFLDPLQMVAVERLCTSEVHGDAMLSNTVLIENLVKDFERTAAVDRVVL